MLFAYCNALLNGSDHISSDLCLCGGKFVSRNWFVRFSNLTPQYYSGLWTVTTLSTKNFFINPFFYIY